MATINGYETREDADILENEAKEDVPASKMRYALIAIAKEVKRFHNPISSEIEDDNINKELKICKSKLRLKKLQIEKLKQNLKTACVIAKTVIAAKEHETASLNNHLTLARQESINFMTKNQESHGVNLKLNLDNRGLNDKLQNIINFIELGYIELQKMRHESTDDQVPEMKLKHIMVCCGQYYADYCSEHEKCTQLEQRNRFLTNKLHILETNNPTTADVKILQYIKKQKSSTPKIGVFCSELFGHQKGIVADNKEFIRNSDNLRRNTNLKLENIDLSSHIYLVKKLLKDQDTMLNDLKQLSNELNSNETVI